MAYGVDRYPNPPDADSVRVYYELEDALLVRRVVREDEAEDEKEDEGGSER